MRTKVKAEWVLRKLDELGFVGRGKSKHRPRNDPSLYGGDYPFIQTGDVKSAALRVRDYSQTYNEKGLAQSKLWDSDTLCITIAANIAETGLLGMRACFPDSIVGFVSDPKASDVRFVKYSIDVLKVQMQNVSRGTTQDNLSLDKLLRFDFPTPPLPVQKKIAAILSAYDDLIENNERRIRILEEMAQNLYREWFVKFRFPGHEKVKMVDSALGKIPQGWEVGRLDEVADVNARSIKRGEEPDEVVYVDIASVTPGTITQKSRMAFREAPGRARRIVEHGDIIWSCVRPNRRSYALVLAPEPHLVVSTGFAVISGTKAPFSYLYFTLTTDDFVGYLTNHATGAAYPAVTAKDFQHAEILHPAKPVLQHFHQTVSPMLELRHKLAMRSADLRQTRDMLLPKLISGEVDVSDLDIKVPEEAA